MARITTEEVERLLKKGKTVKWIANKYKITRQAVYLHVDKIKQKKNRERKKKRLGEEKNYNALIDWHTYNEGLVKRGEFLLDLEVVKDWEKELELMNKGKIGAQFRYPESYILFLIQLKNVFKIDYRTTEGLGRKLIMLIPKAKKNCHYSTLQRRLKKMEVKLKIYQKDYIEEQRIAIDASGLKSTNRGEYRINKYRGKRRQYIKLHIGVNIENSEVVACEVTEESVSDNKKMVELLEAAQRNGNKVNLLLGDRGYDSKENYGKLEESGIEAGIKPRATLTLEKIEEEIRKVNNKVKKGGEGSKKDKKLGYKLIRLKEMKRYFTEPDKWKEEKNYGQRWKSEIRFSVLKRFFGEYVYSKKIENIRNEVMLKVNLMNYFNSKTRGAFRFNNTS